MVPEDCSASSRLYRILAESLPMHAEEGKWTESVSIQSRLDVLISSGATIEIANHCICTTQRILSALSLLDKTSISQDHWQFVSYPAYLLARSLLSCLADNDQNLLPTNYWEQGSHRPDEIVEQQRNILHWLEQQRVAEHCGQNAAPIRFIYVAWAVIKIDGRILMHHREDKTRPQTGNYVLPGGRLNLSDLPTKAQQVESIRAIQCAESKTAYKHLGTTLKRELSEELALEYPRDYTFTEWLTLAPYRDVEGGRNNHAYTEFGIRLYTIALTDIGELKLYDRILDCPENVWFTIQDMARKITPDGRTAYIQALHKQMGDDLQEQFDLLPDSVSNTYTFSVETDAIDLLLSTEPSLLQGKTGKEKPSDLKLSQNDTALLWGLGWHARSLPFSSERGCKLLPHGWVKIQDDSLLAQAKRVAAYLTDKGVPWIEVREEYVRMDMVPSLIHFDPKNYRYQYQQMRADSDQDWEFTLQADSQQTPIGQTATAKKSFTITCNMAWFIQAIEAKKYPEKVRVIKYGDIQKTIRDQVDKNTRSLGLRKFIRNESGSYRIDVKQLSID